MKYVVRLVTTKVLERPLQKFAASQADAESVGVQMLRAMSHPGDRVQVFELAEILVSSLIAWPTADGSLSIDRIDAVTSERKLLG